MTATIAKKLDEARRHFTSAALKYVSIRALLYSAAYFGILMILKILDGKWEVPFFSRFELASYFLFLIGISISLFRSHEKRAGKK